MKDYYEKDIIKKCDVCGNAVAVGSYGSGTCERCGWVQGDNSELKKFNVSYPNLVPLDKARSLFARKEKFLPDFDDFINNLRFYGEMKFLYKNEMYIVERYSDDNSVEFYSNSDHKNVVKFASLEEFSKRAMIGGQQLCNTWSKVKDVNWLR